MGLLSRQLHHLLRKALGDELVRVVLTQEAAIGPLDLCIAGVALESEDGVGLVQSGAPARGLSGRLSSPAGTGSTCHKFVLQTYELLQPPKDEFGDPELPADVK